MFVLLSFFLSLTEKFEENFLFSSVGIAFVNRVTDLLTLLLEYRWVKCGTRRMLLCNNALFVCDLPCSSVECLLHQGPSTSTGGAHTVWSPGPHLFPSLGVDLRTSQRLVMFRIKSFCSQVHCVSLSSKVHLLINLAVETWLSWRTTHKLFSALEFYNPPPSPPATIIILEGLSYSSSLQTTRCDIAMSIKLFDSIFNWRYLKSKIDKCTHLACN